MRGSLLVFQPIARRAMPARSAQNPEKIELSLHEDPRTSPNLTNTGLLYDKRPSLVSALRNS